MEQKYSDEFGKLALALTSAQVAKTTFVKEFGVGEDLAFNFIGWKNSQIKVVCQLNKEFMKELPAQRLKRCSEMCIILKSFWDIDAISMIAEGYCSSDPEKTNGLDLAKVYTEKSDLVNECITVTHVESVLDDEPSVTLASINYKYMPKNSVQYERVRVYPGGVTKILRDKSYPAVLYKTIRDSYFDGYVDESEVIKKLTDLGFYLQIAN